MNRQRTNLLRNSLSKYEKYKDDGYIAFFCLWIGFSAIYKDSTLPICYKNPHSEKELGNSGKKIWATLSNSNCHKSIDIHELKSLIQHINSKYQHTSLQNYIKKNLVCIAHYLEGEANAAHIDQEIGLMFNKVRNNLFHADKDWDQHEEEELVKLMNPLLFKLLEYILKNNERRFGY
jgi:hypothetical protein